MAEKKVRLTVTTELLEREAAAVHPEGVAYAFSSSGRLLARERLGEKGTAALVFAAAPEAIGVRVVVGPDLPGEEVRISELRRRGAVERRLRIDPDTLSPSAKFVVPPGDWRCWLLGRCWVRGTLRKRVESGGMTLDLPVCHATVEVYEVDPLRVILPRLPDLEIERFRDLLIHPPPWPPPIGPLPPGPFPRGRTPDQSTCV